MTNEIEKKSLKNNGSREIRLAFEKDGYLLQRTIDGLQRIRVKDYAFLFVENSMLFQDQEEKVHLFFFQPNTTIVLKELDNVNVDDSSKICLLLFPYDTVGHIKLKYRNYTVTTKAISKFLSFDNDVYLSSFLENLKTISVFEDTTQKELLHFRIQEFLVYLIDAHGPVVLDFLFKKAELDFTSFQSLVQRTIFKDLSLEELAFTCNMSVSKFKRTFKVIFNDTPMNWLREKRILESCNLLKNSGKNIVEISELVGYKNPSNFIKVFKKYYGMTPKEYRDKYSQV